MAYQKYLEASGDDFHLVVIADPLASASSARGGEVGCFAYFSSEEEHSIWSLPEAYDGPKVAATLAAALATVEGYGGGQLAAAILDWLLSFDGGRATKWSTPSRDWDELQVVSSPSLGGNVEEALVDETNLVDLAFRLELAGASTDPNFRYRVVSKRRETK